jgi:hypothetical protein
VNFSIGKAFFISAENMATMLSYLFSLKKATNLVLANLKLSFSTCEKAELKANKNGNKLMYLIMNDNLKLQGKVRGSCERQGGEESIAFCWALFNYRLNNISIDPASVKTSTTFL